MSSQAISLTTTSSSFAVFSTTQSVVNTFLETALEIGIYVGVSLVVLLCICIAYGLGVCVYQRRKANLVFLDAEADKKSPKKQAEKTTQPNYTSGKTTYSKTILPEENLKTDFIDSREDSIKKIIHLPYKGKTIKSGETITVGVKGEKIYCGDYSIDIPPKALLKDTELTFSVEEGIPCIDTFICIGPTLKCEPSGTQFNKAIIVSVSTSFASRKKEKLVKTTIFVRHDVDKQWQKESTVKLSTDGKLVYKARHFSERSPQVSQRALRDLNRNFWSVGWLRHFSDLKKKTLSWYIMRANNPSYSAICDQFKSESALDLQDFTARADRPLYLVMQPTQGLVTDPTQTVIDPVRFNNNVNCSISSAFLLQNVDGERMTRIHCAVKQLLDSGSNCDLATNTVDIEWVDPSPNTSTQSFHLSDSNVDLQNGDRYYFNTSEDSLLLQPDNQGSSNTPHPVGLPNTSSRTFPRRQLRTAPSSSQAPQQPRPLSEEIRTGTPARRYRAPSNTSTPTATLERPQPVIRDNRQEQFGIATIPEGSVSNRLAQFESINERRTMR